MYEHLELTVIEDFTMWNFDTKPPTQVGQWRRGEAITNPNLIARILDSEQHVRVVKVPKGTHDRPTDEELAEREAVAVAAAQAEARAAEAKAIDAEAEATFRSSRRVPRTEG